MTPFWYLATPITLPLAYLAGSFSAMYGNDVWATTLTFYTLPLQMIFAGITLMFNPPTSSPTAAIRPADSQEPRQEPQESPAASHESPTATTKPAAERLLSTVGNRPRSEPATEHRVATLPLRRAALSVPVPDSISPDSPTESGESDAPPQNGAPEQPADLEAIEQRAISDVIRSGSYATASNNKAVRSR